MTATVFTPQPQYVGLAHRLGQWLIEQNGPERADQMWNEALTAADTRTLSDTADLLKDVRYTIGVMHDRQPFGAASQPAPRADEMARLIQLAFGGAASINPVPQLGLAQHLPELGEYMMLHDSHWPTDAPVRPNRPGVAMWLVLRVQRETHGRVTITVVDVDGRTADVHHLPVRDFSVLSPTHPDTQHPVFQARLEVRP